MTKNPIADVDCRSSTCNEGLQVVTAPQADDEGWVDTAQTREEAMHALRLWSHQELCEALVDEENARKAERDALKAKLAEVERERDEAQRRLGAMKSRAETAEKNLVASRDNAARRLRERDILRTQLATARDEALEAAALVARGSMGPATVM